MTVLAIETTTSVVGVALAEGSGVLAVVAARTSRHHAEVLHPAIDEACRLAGVELDELEGIAVDVGPGMFTGIRVGVSAAKGLAVSLGLGVVGRTSLQILADAVSAAGGVPLPVVDLRRGEVAWALPSGVAGAGTGLAGGAVSAPVAGTGTGPAGGAVSALVTTEHGPPSRLAAVLRDRASAWDSAACPLVLVGDGAWRHSAELLESAGPGVRLGGAELAVPPVASLAVTACGEVAAGRPIDPLGLEPVYLRDADTRINWSTRHDAPGRAAD